MTDVTKFNVGTQKLESQMVAAQFKRGLNNLHTFDVRRALLERGCDLSGNCDM